MRGVWATLGVLLMGVIYLLAWPVAIDPVAWRPPPDPGYVGSHQRNEGLSGLRRIPLPDHHGPEDVAVGPDGALFVSTHEGDVLRLTATSSTPEVWAHTGGRPLGLAFGPDDRLWVADGIRGLLSIGFDRTVRDEVTTFKGDRLGFADDVDVGADGTVYFTDASTKFAPSEYGGTYPASLLDLLEHGGHGRVYAYDGERTRLLAADLQFANGVAVTPDGRGLLVAETGRYRILRIDLATGEVRVVLDRLPGFPDNVETGGDGVFWVGLVSARSRPVDVMAPHPWLRRLVQRLPEALRPDAVVHPHVFALDAEGNVLADLQASGLDYPKVTGARAWRGHLVVTSLVADALGYVPGAATATTVRGGMRPG